MELDFVGSEDEIGGYTPLERPSCSSVSNVQTIPERSIIVYSDEESNESSSVDSDDAIRTIKNSRKRKLPPSNYASNSNIAKKTKFTIWSDILQEDAIENQFSDSKFFSGSRGNETYNYRMKYFSNRNETNSHQNDGDKNQNKAFKPFSKKKQFKNSFNRGKNLKKPITLPKLNVTGNDTEEVIANDIAEKLNEPKVELILRVVDVLGKQKAIEFYKETRRIEERGGYLTCDRTRRRTSGGVYLKVVKNYNKISREQHDLIFSNLDDGNRQEETDHEFPEMKDTHDMMLSDSSELAREMYYKDLPTRAELELSMGMEENETNILKNPPPSPVHPTASLSTSPCSLTFVFPGTSDDAGSASPTCDQNLNNSDYNSNETFCPFTSSEYPSNSVLNRPSSPANLIE